MEEDFRYGSRTEECHGNMNNDFFLLFSNRRMKFKGNEGKTKEKSTMEIFDRFSQKIKMK